MTSALIITATPTETYLVPGKPAGTENVVFQPVALEEGRTEWVLAEVEDVPFEFDPQNFDGVTVTTFYDDWYNRIHLVPQRFDLANVVSDQTREIVMWNAYTTPMEIESNDFPLGAGIAVIDPVGAPYTMAPLEAVYYTVVVRADGPPTIDDALEWVIEGVTYQVYVTGRRIVVWPFGPNWSQPWVENLDWLTDVFTAFAGNEQRFELRSKPRRNFEYTALVQKSEASVMRNLLWGWQNRNYALPVWGDRTILTAPVNVGDTSISFDTTHRGFFNGGLVVLLRDPLDYEVIEIDSVGSDHVTLAKGMERAWPATTKAYPVNICKMPTNISSRSLTDGVAEVVLAFNADPLQTDPNIPLIAATDIHAGYEIILRKPNWAQPVQIENQFDYDVVDFQVGGVLSEQTREFPLITRRFQWVLKSRDEMNEFRGLLGRLKGRFKAAYLPTWFDDFELYADVTASAQSIPVKNNEFFKMVGEDPALSTVMILVQGQAPIIRSILTVSADPTGFTMLGLNAAVGHDLNANTLRRISLVHLCRLTTDRVTINWLSDSVATVEANFTLVKQ